MAGGVSRERLNGIRAGRQRQFRGSRRPIGAIDDRRQFPSAAVQLVSK
jgi:hypothetical protein